MKKIFVTGATGFIGQYVVQQLLEGGHYVIATSANKQKALNFSWFPKVDYIELDFKNINQSIDYFAFFGKPDLMIHLAWEGLPNYKSLFHFENNLPNHYWFLKNLIGNGLKDLLITGTCLEYGMREGSLTEDMSVQPDNPYALAKDTLRKFLHELQKTNPLCLKWVRLFYMYGKGQNPNSLLSQLENALENDEKFFKMSAGDQTRDYLHVATVAEYIIKIALQQKITGIINCSSNNPITVKAFVENYLRQKNKSIKLNLGHYPYPDYEPMHFWGDNNKLKRIITNE